MFKTMKWIYKLGVLHERRRVRMLIAQHRLHKPTPPMNTKDNMMMNDFLFAESVWHQVDNELRKLVEPYYQEPVLSLQPDIKTLLGDD
jgi:hypothetical protein